MTRDDFLSLSKQIHKWHCQTFRLNDYFSQFLKVEEEIGEFWKDSNLEELADCYIAISALKYRYNSKIGTVLLNNMIDIIIDSPLNEKYYNAINDKFEIDKKRVFKKVGKVERHI